jgi:hypothetical protein
MNPDRILDAISDALRWACEHPPVTWCTNANRWLADRLVSPWLDPLLRPFEHRAARRRLADLVELRSQLAEYPAMSASVRTLGQAIAIAERRVVETAERGQS